MALKREEQRRAVAYGYYSTYGADASDILGYIEGDLTTVSEFKDDYASRVFKVTIIVEEE